MARTGGGGFHLYYTYSPRHNSARIMELTDIRGDGGQVVAAPSLHKSGKEYVFLNEMEPQPFPERLFVKEERKDFLKTGVEVKLSRGLGKMTISLPDASDGNRNQTATQACGKLMRLIPPYDWGTAVWDRLNEWNLNQCSPPLDELELRGIYDKIAARAINDQPNFLRHDESAGSNFSSPAVHDDHPAAPAKITKMSWADAMDVGFAELSNTKPEDVVSYGYNFLDEAMTGLMPADLPLFGGTTGCHGKGHPIMMWDGSRKKVEEIAEGDHVMGPDGSARRVVALHRGIDWMVEIKPTGKKAFVVNSGHVLSVRYEVSRRGSLERNPYRRGGEISDLVNLKASSYLKYMSGKSGVIASRNRAWFLWIPQLPKPGEAAVKGRYAVKKKVMFRAKDAGLGRYYGFELEDGDRLYLDGNGFVHHNSGKTTLVQNILRRIDAAGHKVMLVALEDRVQDYAIKNLFYKINELAMERGKPRYPWNAFRKNQLFGDTYRELAHDALKEIKKCGIRLVTCDGRLGFRDLKRLMDEAVDEGFKVLALDHLHHMDFGNGNKNDAIERFMVDAKHEINKNGLRLPIVAHYRKVNGEMPTIESFKDSSALGQNASYVINIWRERGESAGDLQKKGKETKMEVTQKLLLANSGKLVDTHFIIPKARNPNGERHMVIKYSRETGDYLDTPAYGDTARAAPEPQGQKDRMIDISEITW
jgi:hypothetical protein